jgi:hypothetical protein
MWRSGIQECSAEYNVADESLRRRARKLLEQNVLCLPQEKKADRWVPQEYTGGSTCAGDAMPREKISLPAYIVHLSILNEYGQVDDALLPDLSEEQMLRIYRAMLLGRRVD